MGSSPSSHAVRPTVLSPAASNQLDFSPFQRSKNRTSSSALSPRPPICEPLHPDLRTRSGDDGGLAHAVGTRRRARVAARYCAAGTTPGRVDGILALYEAPCDAGAVDGEHGSRGGERRASDGP